ncbi:MAG: hypothetical protein WCD70_15095 [Alphaproteobacteria bacterium]
MSELEQAEYNKQVWWTRAVNATEQKDRMDAIQAVNELNDYIVSIKNLKQP